MNLINALVQMARSVSFWDAILALYLAFGMYGLLFGIYKLLRRQRVTKRALDRERKTCSANPLLANTQLDDETLARMVRFDTRVESARTLGWGLGSLVGCLCGWLFYRQVGSHFPPGEETLEVAIYNGLILVCTLLGLRLGETLSGILWRKPAGQLLPPALLRLRLYRPGWLLVLECVTVAVCVLAAGLTVSGVVPGGGGFSRQQALWLAILVPALVTLFALGPELFLWLSLHYPPWPNALPQALALKVVASRYQVFASGLPYVSTCAFIMPILLLGMGEGPFLSFAFGCLLGLMGIAWLFTFVMLMARQALHGKTIRASFVGALAPLAGDGASQEA